ncbi:MAG: Phospho-N-acetylmuramoyl-pentapeptide-transferase [Candidatus Pacebacteria bacterium GW2011_GWF1_36_5]|nr:MAG: Phospho-N-acetylmuramoyl-pentapeptide-transferase [Candidatus Pacebacteria bacterium GW2011_GWF1_36_5]
MGSLALFLGILIFSFTLTSTAVVPFINLLYKLRFRRQDQKTLDAFGERTPIFDKFHASKAGVPVGGGLLVVIMVSLLFALMIPALNYFGIDVTSIHRNSQAEVNVLFFTFLSFAILGLYDDIKKFFRFDDSKFFGLRMRQKLILQMLLAIIIACMIYFQLEISILHIPFVGTIQLGYFYIPFAAFVIVAFANAVNITDGLDGLAAGLLLFSLFGLWVLSSTILDVPLSVFLALWLGSLVSFLYFNVFPARIFISLALLFNYFLKNILKRKLCLPPHCI